MRSFSRNYYEQFDNYISVIRRIGQTIQGKAEIGSQAEIRDLHCDVRNIGQEFQGLKDIVGKQGRERIDAQRQFQSQIEHLWNDAIEQQNQLLSKDQSRDETSRDIVTMLKSIFRAEEGPRMIEDDKQRAEASVAKIDYDRLTLEIMCERLQGFIVRQDMISSMLSDPQPRSLSHPMFHRLQDLIALPKSASLWLIGPQDNRYPSDMSTVTACIISVLAQAESQLILHFCALLTVANPGMSEEESGLISLLYSLISQLVFHLKSALESSIDLSDERFSRLDGTMTTWSVALCLFEDLVSLSLPYVICVIDGIEWSITDIMEGKENRVLKVLFTTAGNSQTLMDVLDAESIFCESEIGQTRNSPFKQTGKGMMPLTEL